MSQRTNALALQFLAEHERLLAQVSACTPEQWHRLTADEGWTVAVTAHHIAVGYPNTLMAVIAAAGAQARPRLTLEMLSELNAQHAREYADVSVAEDA